MENIIVRGKEMRLSRRINAKETQNNGVSPKPDTLGEKYNTVKSKIHLSLVDRLDLTTVTDLSSEELAGTIRSILNEITAMESIPLNLKERSTLISELIYEITGFGPLQTLLEDESVQDILVNGYSQVMVEREGLLYPTGVRFRDDRHLMHIIDKIVSSVGRRVDEASPMVDARLPDGSRVNVIIPPLALDGPMLSIRKFGTTRITGIHLLEKKALSPAMMTFLNAAIRAKLNILISGGTGAGKTTLLNVLSENIPENERIITIEDSAELQLHQTHVVRLESRPPNIEGKGQVRLSDLVKNSLRMRPDRIIVGESRGAEVIDMLQAMNTGHPGSMSTVHANSPMDALTRLEVMATMGDINFNETALRTLISSAIHLIVHITRLGDGTRRITHISEVSGIREGTIALTTVFALERTGTDADQKTSGVFKGLGRIPNAVEHIRLSGISLDPDMFKNVTEI
jgi:pilus assembly protein CpaF